MAENSQQNHNKGSAPKRTKYCPPPLAVTDAVILTTVLSVVAKWGLGSIEYFAFLYDLPYVVIWAVIGILIVLNNYLTRYTRKCRNWVEDHPVQSWRAYPKDTSSWLILVLIVIVFLLSGYTASVTWWESFSIWSLIGLGSATTQQENTSSTEQETVTTGDNVASSGKLEPFSGNWDPKNAPPLPQITFPGAPPGSCENVGYAHPLCLSGENQELGNLYWTEMVKLKIEDVSYPINRVTKCVYCGNLFTGTGREPNTCNPFISKRTGITTKYGALTGGFCQDHKPT